MASMQHDDSEAPKSIVGSGKSCNAGSGVKAELFSPGHLELGLQGSLTKLTISMQHDDKAAAKASWCLANHAMQALESK